LCAFGSIIAWHYPTLGFYRGNAISELFKNAIGSIRMGVQDYGSSDEHRHISAVRNFYAGILLLAKEVLVRRFPNEDPDTLLASNLKPVVGCNGTVQMIPASQKTIDFETIGRRFKDLGIPLQHASLKRLNTIRNDVEHKYTTLKRNAIVEAIAEGFPVTGQLFRLIGENPVTALGNEWQVMLETRDLFDAELAECRITVAPIEWRSSTVESNKLICSECESALVEQIDPSNSDQDATELCCRACGAQLETGDVIEKTVEDALGAEAYMRHKDAGEDGPIYGCPECDKDTYIDFEDACANCGHSMDSSGGCAICGEPFPLADLLFDPDMTLCSYHQHVMNKDD
jgi:hypothetical protein